MSESPRLQDSTKLRRKRIEAGMNPSDLAKAAGYDVSHILFLERGKRSATARSLGRIAEALGCPITDLIAPGAFDAPDSGVAA
jgi:transcriptional regulator with XRE-family HTH domain